MQGYNRKGTALQGLGKLGEAIRAFQKGLEIEPGNEALKLAQMRGHMNALMATVDVGPPRFSNY